MADDDLKVFDVDDASNEISENLDITDMNKNKIRIRGERITKKTEGCGIFCGKIFNWIQEKFQKCGFCREELEQSQFISPPKRIIYYGEMFDNIDDDKRQYVKEPHLEDEDKTAFVSNYISTKKYSLITFIPVNLFEQFRRVANIYFLIISVLSTTKLSPKNPLFSIFPLSVVLAVSAIKEAYEDYV